MGKGWRVGRVAGKSAAAATLVALLLGGGQAAAQSVVSGQALVQAKDVSRKTLTVEGRVLSVTAESDLRSREGAPIGLEELRAVSEQKALGGMLVDVGAVDLVDYRARELEGRFVLDQLRVIELPR